MVFSVGARLLSPEVFTDQPEKPEFLHNYLINKNRRPMTEGVTCGEHWSQHKKTFLTEGLGTARLRQLAEVRPSVRKVVMQYNVG